MGMFVHGPDHERDMEEKERRREFEDYEYDRDNERDGGLNLPRKWARKSEGKE